MWDSPKAMLTYHDRGFSRMALANWVDRIRSTTLMMYRITWPTWRRAWIRRRHAGSGLKISLVKLENVENTALMGQRYHRFS